MLLKKYNRINLKNISDYLVFEYNIQDLKNKKIQDRIISRVNNIVIKMTNKQSILSYQIVFQSDQQTKKQLN